MSIRHSWIHKCQEVVCVTRYHSLYVGLSLRMRMNRERERGEEMGENQIRRDCLPENPPKHLHQQG